MPVIRVSGNPGSGKTTLSKKLSEALGYDYHYTGGLILAIAEERNETKEMFYEKLKENPVLERAIDSIQEKLMETVDNIVVEGRMAPFLKCSFLTINLFVGVQREEGVKRQLQRKGNAGLTFEEMNILTAKRVLSERERYKMLYGIEDHLDTKHFDIVIDTTNYSQEEVFSCVLGEIRKRISK